MDPDHPLLSIETTFSRLKTILCEQHEQLTWNEKLKYFDDFRLTFWNIDLFDQAISTRLPKLANGKRDFLGYLDLVNSNNLNFPSFDNDAAQGQDQKKDSRYSEEPECTQCAKKRRLQVNYEPESMPSDRPGTRNRRHHRRTKSKPSPREEVLESPDAHTPSRSTAIRIVDLDSDNDAEDESESLHESTSKVLPGIGTTNTPLRRGLNPTIEGLPIPAKDKTSWEDDGEEGELTGIWGVENEWKKTRRGKREKKPEVIDLEEHNPPPKTPPPKSHKGKSVGFEGGEVDANAHEHNESANSTSAPWYAPHSRPGGREQLARILGKVHPQFPLVSDSPKSASAYSPPGRVKPESADSMSRLLGRSRVGVINGGVKPVNNLGQPKPFVPLKRKAFNLSTNLPIPSQLRNKRQRTNGRASESTTSSNELIDLDSPPPQHRPSTKKSVLSKSRPTQSNNGDISSVDEYSNVEKQINPSRRSESTASRHFRLPSSKQSANPHEDDTDPIIDVDMPSHQPSGKGLQKSYLPDKPYSGTAKRDDSRPRPSFWGTHSDSSKPKVLPSHLDDLEKKPSSNSAKRKHESAGSMDELAVGHDSKKKTTKKESPEKTRADELLKAALAGVNGAEKFVYLDDTDDEKVAKKIDLAPSVSKKLKNPAKKPGEITLQVKEAFSNVATFKTTPGDRWLFVCNIDEEVCRIFDGDGKLKDEVFTKSIRAIDSSEDSAKMVLHRLADGNTKRASDTYLELGSNNESADLVEQLRKLNSTLTRTFPTAVQINKVFSFNRDRLFQQKPTRQNPPEDLQLIEKNAETRQIQKRAEELKRAGNGRAQNGAVQSQRSEGRARRMANSVTGDTIAPNKFYNQSSDRGADPSPPPPTRSSARIQKKEPVYQERPRSPTPIPVVKWTELHPHWNDLWLDTVVYPPGPGHKRTATVDRGDIPRLDEEEFLNDSLVNFYLRYLEHDLEQKRPEVAKRIYFQNSFFYERLTKPAAGGKKGIDYAAVQRWTKGVDLFSKDYIIVPVCENIHWYVAIICNAPKLLKPDVVEDAVEAKTPTKTNTDLKEDAPASHSSPGNPEDNGDPMKMESLQNSLEECMEHEKLAVESPESRRTVQESNDQHETNPPDSHPIANIVSDLEPKTAENSAKAKPTRKAPMDRSLDPNAPRIIILDSLGGGHPVTSKNLRDYLVAEMKDKHGKEISPPRQMHFPAKNLEGQQNYSDCGLFLLSYIQKFLESPESFISSILGNEGKPSWVQPKKMRQDIRNHLFKLQPQSPKKKKRPPKPSDDARAVPSRPASRDASGATRAGTQNQTEHFPPPPRKPSEKKNAPNGVALAPTNASTNTTHNSKSAPRLFNPAAPAEALAKMPNSTVSRSHKESNLAAAQEVVEVANGTGSERISNQKPIVSESSNSKWRTNSNPNVTDEDNSSRLQELTGSSQVVPHSLTRKKSEAESRVSKLFRAMGDSVNGFMGRGQDAVDKGDVSKGLGNSESYPLAIDDSPAKPARGGYDSEQKRPSRRQSSESVEVISSRARSSRKKSRPGQPRDSPSRYERENVGSDEVLEPPSPGLRNPDLGDMAGQASEPTLATTEQKNGNKSPVGLNENDEDEMLIHATNACVSGTSAPKADSSTMEKNPRQISSSPPRDRSPALSFKFIIKEDEDEDSSAQQSPPSPTAGRSFSQQSLTTYGKHTRWDADEGEIASM